MAWDDEIPQFQKAAPPPFPHALITSSVLTTSPKKSGSEVRALKGWGPYNPIVGHEGIGEVRMLGPDAPAHLLGKRVGVKWLYSACGSCSVCDRGHANNCPRQLNTGKHRPGTLQEWVVADGRYLTVIPDELDAADAAPLLCAGLSMMGAVAKLDGELSPGDWVVVQGSGGGLGHLGVQIAAGMRGYRVIGVDSGTGKESMTTKLGGAEVFVDYATEDVERRVLEVTGEGAHATIVVSGSEDAYRIAPQLVRSMGTIVCVGLPHGDFQMPVSVIQCAAKALTIKGAMVGTEEQMTELMEAAIRKTIRPMHESFALDRTQDVMSRLVEGDVFGKALISLR